MFCESYGISNWVKNSSEYIYNKLLKSEINDNQIELVVPNIYNDYIKMENIRILFEFSDKNYGKFDDTYCSINNAVLNNVQIIINSTEINTRVKDIIVHELTHIYEYYKMNLNNKKFPKYFGIKKLLKSIKNDNKYKFEPFNEFLYILYTIQDNELNARVAEIYPSLKDISDINNLSFDEVKYVLRDHQVIKNVFRIMNFNHIDFVDACVDKIGLYDFLSLSNVFLDNVKNNNIIVYKTDLLFDINDLYNFYKKFKNLFDNKIKKHISKIESIIKNIDIN